MASVVGRDEVRGASRKHAGWGRTALWCVLAAGGMALLVQPAAAGTLASTSVSAASLSTGAATSYSFTFKPATAWPANGKLAVTFPSDYSGLLVAPTTITATVSPSATGCGGSGSVGGFTGSVSGLVMTLTRSGTGGVCATTDTVTVTANGVTNPHTAVTTGTFTFATQLSTGSTLDSQGAITGVKLTPAPFGQPSVTSSDAVVSEAVSTTFRFQPTNPWPATGTFVVRFPDSYGLALGQTAPSVTVKSDSTANPCSGSYSVAWTGKIATVTRSATSACNADGTHLNITLGKMVNPPGAMAKGYVYFHTQDGSGHDIDASSGYLTVVSGHLTAAVNPSTLTAGAVASVPFAFTANHTWTAQPHFEVQWPVNASIPSGYASTAGQTDVTITGCVDNTGAGGLTVTTPVVVTGNRTNVSFAGACRGPATITFNRISYPPASGPVTLRFKTLTKNNNDTDLGTTTLNLVPAALQSPIVAAQNLTVLASPLYNFTFTLTNPWPAHGFFAVALPGSFGVTSPTAALRLVTGECPAGNLTATASQGNATWVTMARSAGALCKAGSRVQVTLSGLVNPAGAAAQTVRFATGDERQRAIDSSTATITTLPAAVRSLAWVASDPVVAHASSLTATVHLRNAWPAGGSLLVTPPPSFALASPGVTSATGCDGTYVASVTGTNSLLVRRSGTDCAGNGTLVFTTTGWTNAGVAKAYPFTVTLANATGSATETGQATLTLLPGHFTSLLIAPSSSAAGSATTLALNLGFATLWPGNGALTVTLPTGWHGFDAPTSPSASFNEGGCASGSLRTLASGSVVTITRILGAPCAAGSAAEIDLAGMTAPHVSGSSLPIAIATSDGSGNPIDMGSGSLVVTPATFMDSDVEADVAAAGMVTSWAFHVTPANGWPGDGQFDATFPGGFALGSVQAKLTDTCLPGSGSAACQCASSPLTASVAGQRVHVVRSGAACPTGLPLTITLTQIGNPHVSGSAGLVQYMTSDAAGLGIDQGSQPLSIDPGQLILSGFQPADPRAGFTTSYTISVTPVNGWPAHASLLVEWPSGYASAGTHDVSVRGCSPFGAHDVGQSLALTPLSGGCSGPLTITVSGITNPTLAGPRQVPLLTETADGLPIDTARAPVIIAAGPAARLSIPDPPGPGAAGLPVPLDVLVVDSLENPVPGVTVTWSSEGGALAGSWSFTGMAGNATNVNTLPAGAGKVTAAVTGLSGSPVTFQFGSGQAAPPAAGSGGGAAAAAVPAAAAPAPVPTPATTHASPAHLSPQGAQSRPAGQSVRLSVQVADAAGKPLAGILVEWHVRDGQGTLASPTSISDASGTASVLWTSTTAGTAHVDAVVSGLSASLSATVVAGALDHLEAVRQADGSFVMQGRDEYGNAVPVPDSMLTMKGGTCQAGRCTATTPGTHTVTVAGGTIHTDVQADAGGVGQALGHGSPGLGAPLLCLGLLALAALGRARKD
ncbi:MAG: Ig-like domain-containing protein [Thermoplasmatota archaeon]